MLKTRLLTALVLLPLLAWLLVAASAEAFRTITLLLVLLAAWEWNNLMAVAASSRRLGYVVGVLLGALAATQVSALWVLAAALLWWCYALYAVIDYGRDSKKNQFMLHHGLGKAIAGVATLIPLWVALTVLREATYGTVLLCYVFLLVILADTGAYFAGRRWGKHRLAPAVSPGKSWQGVAGGISLVLILAVFAAEVLTLPWAQGRGFIFMSLLLGLISVLGDLTESLYKRVCGIKDSGRLLPGHGGILDRIDGLTSAVPCFALMLLATGVV